MARPLPGLPEATAKDVRLAPIGATDARRLVRAMHYSGKVVQNSRVHFGVFLGDRCGGVLSYGPSIDQRRMLSLVRGTRWGEFIELNRMALADWLPRNSESRALAVSFRLLRKAYPHLKWIVSFADAGQCGDGAIYRAAGFVLTQIKPLAGFIRLPGGRVIHRLALENRANASRPELGGKSYFDVTGGSYSVSDYMRVSRGEKVAGFSLRYLFFLDPSQRANLTCPVLPYSAIDDAGARMYRGERIERRSSSSRTPAAQAGNGGASPTPTLQAKPNGGRHARSNR